MSPESITFDRAASYYDETRGFPPGVDRRVAAFIREVVGLTGISRVIEVGVGTGRVALPLAREVGAVYGVDISRTMLRRLRSKQTGEPVHIAEADATRLPFAAQRFDAAIGVHIFHLVPTWQDALREVARVLRPGAPLLDAGGGTTSYDPLWEIWNSRWPKSRAPVGANRETLDAFLAAEGWQPMGQERFYEYNYEQAPQVFLDQLQNRVWSSTWRWTDEQLTTCLEFMRAGIQERFGDPRQPTRLQGQFSIRAFLPPRR